MEPRRPEEPPMEVLDDERPPGFVGRRLAPVLARPKVRAGAAVGGVLALLGGWAAFSPEGAAERSEAQQAAAEVEAPGLRPPPARGRERGTEPWKVRGEVSTRSGPGGNTFTFVAVNRGSRPADAGNLQVEAGYLDRPEAVYTVACEGVRRAEGRLRPLRGLVAPGRQVLVRCLDAPEDPRPPRMAPLVVTVSVVPCEDSAELPGV